MDLCVENISAGYGKAFAIRDLSVRVPHGSVVAVVGPNGAGKSTLLRAISGDVRVRRGRITFGDITISGRPSHEIARQGIIHVAETRDIFGTMSVWENLKVAFDNLNPDADEEETFERVYRLFPVLRERRAHSAGNLSGGQQQMLAIARALVGGPKVLMLDEPSLGLAQLIIAEIYKSLQFLRDSGLTVLLIEQFATMALQFADYSLVLVNGKIVLEGERTQMIADQNVVKHYLSAINER